MLRKLSRKLLSFAEKFYLKMHGWRKDKDNLWHSPEGYPKPKNGVARGHAINSMKQLDDNLKSIFWTSPPPN